jgi:2,4-dienoyl-CoA reductase-like NADH-dependent reductase (Old Yellow Enzyme family)
MELITVSYEAAAGRAREAGFDAVQIHAAHGYTLAKFISPLFNQRDDAYGGSAENRARFIVDIFKAMKAGGGENYPVLIKMNGADFIDGGMAVDDSTLVAEILDKEGIDAIEPSGGSVGGSYNSRGPLNKDEWEENFYMHLSEGIKKQVKTPVIMVGGLRRFETVEAVIQEGRADLIAFSRPFLREPDLVNRWEGGDRTPSTCISCNGCSGFMMKGEPGGCVFRQ